MSDEADNEFKEKEQLLKERLEHLNEVKASYLEAKDALPALQNDIEITQWQLNIHQNRPMEASIIYPNTDRNVMKQENDYFKHTFTVANVPSIADMKTSGSIAASGTTDYLEYLSEVNQMPSPQARTYVNICILELHEMQQKQKRTDEARDFIDRLGSLNTLERFDRAYRAYMEVRAGAGEPTAAGMEIRTMLDGVKGLLFEKACRWPKENMIWPRMAERLAKGGRDGLAYTELANLEATYGNLITRLSNVGKDRTKDPVKELDEAWMAVLEHLHIISGLIEV